MAESPERRARADIDRLLAAAGWAVQRVEDADRHAARGVAICEFPLKEGHGFADYLLYVDGKACGVIEAKKHGATLTGVEIQSARYAQGLPEGGKEFCVLSCTIISMKGESYGCGSQVQEGAAGRIAGWA